MFSVTEPTTPAVTSFIRGGHGFFELLHGLAVDLFLLGTNRNFEGSYSILDYINVYSNLGLRINEGGMLRRCLFDLCLVEVIEQTR